MAIEKDSKVALVMDTRQHLEIFQAALVKNKMNKVVQFGSVGEAYETLSRQQFDLLIVSLELPDAPGVTLMQKLREVGNYGLEPFLFVGKNFDEATFKLFIEYDVEYILNKEVTAQSAEEKVQIILKRENNIPDEVQMYRDAKSAYISGIYDMALDFCQQLFDNDKLKAKAYTLAGDIAFKQEKLDEAEGYFTKAIAADEKYIAAVHRLANVHMARGNYDKAKVHLDKLAQINPQHIKILENAGTSNLELGFIELAKSQMSQLEKIDKTNKTAGVVQTKISIKEGNFDGISERLKVSHSEKELVSLLNSAGIKLSKEGDVEGAIKIYADCLGHVRKKEYKGKINFNLAIAYRRLGNAENAIKYCQQAIRVYPELTKAKEMLAELQKQAA